ncbi:hypothetical protein [Terrimicrobium sacchariphilum]|uniref:hypothetical protein n=1 Tax=Terrimicrobium sacchariphilum TaxID=690879 RepID=UPI00129BC4E0|nr:hypothetical protein [Terrimicrobium sacchariphilum]
MKRLTHWGLSLEKQIAMRVWPEEENAALYLDVLELAREMLDTPDQAHSISAILLFQQLVEELLWLLDYSCFYEQVLGIYPSHYEYFEVERLMFGQLIDRIRRRQDFSQKNEILEIAQSINSKCRIPVAHKMIDRGNLAEVVVLAKECGRLFDRFLQLFEEARMHFIERYEALADRTGVPSVPRP